MAQARPESIWLTAMDWFQVMDRKLPSIWPSEFPPESAPGFWTQAAQLEMEHRRAVSTQIAEMIRSGEKPESATPLELWFYRRRIEWAVQLMLAKAEEGVEPDAALPEVLEWAVIGSWDSDGCIGFWNHAVERGGKPHPAVINGEGNGVNILRLFGMGGNTRVNLPGAKKSDEGQEVDLSTIAAFHFQCPLCGAKTKETPLSRLAEQLRNRNHQDVQMLVFRVYAAVRTVAQGSSRWLTKKFQKETDNFFRIAFSDGNAELPNVPDIHTVLNEKTMMLNQDCPFCHERRGPRSRDDYFTNWGEACKVQTSNLCFETSLVMLAMAKDPPRWAGPDMVSYFQELGQSLYRTACGTGMMICPLCARPTNYMAGATDSKGTNGMCRWCMDRRG